MPVIPDSKDKLVNLEDMRALYEHELRDSTVKFIDGQPGFTPAGSMQLGTGCVGSLTPVERFGIYKVTSGSMSDLTDFSSAFSMTNVGFSCSPYDFNGSSTVSYDGSSTMKNSLAGFESNKNKSVLFADIDEMEVDGGSSSYTGNRARAALTSSFLDGISSALILDVSDRHREFDLTLQVTSGEYSMSSDSPVFVKTDPNLSPIGKLAPVSPSPSVPMILPEIDDLPTPRRTDADLPGLVVPDDDTIVCENNGIISIKRRGVSEPLLSPDVMSQLTGLQEIGPTGIANIENALPGPLITTKVMGQSNQQQEPAPSPENPQEITNLNKAELVITGKNLINVSKEAVSDKCATQTNGYKIENGVITFTSISNWGADYIFFNEANVLGVDKLTFSMKATKAIGASNNNGAKFLCKAFDSEGKEIKVEQGLSTKEYEWGYNEYYKAYCQLFPNNTLTITLRPNIAKIRFGVCFSDAQAGTNVEIRDFQIEVDSKATTYEPHQSKSTPIDLKGNELLSIPNGVRDEVVIDAEGNVSLIKRVAKYVVPENVYAQDEPNNFGVQLELNAVDGKYLHKQLCPENAKYNPSVNWMTVFKEGNSWANLQEFKQWFIGTEFYYGTKNPETIQLGKVELPALPEATSNVWNNGNIPADVSIIFYNENGRLLSKAIPEVDVATVDEVKKFLGIK